MTGPRAWLLVAAAAALGPWLDGQPSETEVTAAVQADLLEAQADARRQQHLARAEAAMRQQERACARRATLGEQP
ncbi:MAG: hypothetical protein LBI48_04450 [Burkholderiaceae bacterium]|jgi:hypothetical protein|nr:hypothetical protein [Burkholderiaceae bacterium]